MRQVQWTWITGNHDIAADMGAGANVCAEQEVDGLILRHEADPADKRPELSGHFHPKLRMTLRGKNLSRRCFILSGLKIDRKSVVQGKSVSGRVESGGRGIMKNKKEKNKQNQSKNIY